MKLLLFLTTISLSWAITQWFLGVDSEKKFKNVTHKILINKNILKIEQLNHQKSFTGAKSSLKLSSEVPFIRGVLKLNVRRINGPFFIDKTGVSFGYSRWLLSSSVQQKSSAVGDGDPQPLLVNHSTTAMIHRGFDKKLHYVLKSRFGSIKGSYDPESHLTQGVLALQNFSRKTFMGELMIGDTLINYQYKLPSKSKSTSTKITFQMPSLTINANKLTERWHLQMQGKGEFTIKNAVLSGFFDADIDSKSSVIPLKKGYAKLSFKGVSIDGLFLVDDANRTLSALHQQVSWQLEEGGEFPEGQDQIWQSYDQINQLSRQLPVLINEIFTADNSIQLKVVLKDSHEESKLTATLKIPHPSKVNALQHSLFSKNGGDTATIILNGLSLLLAGDASVVLGDELFNVISQKTAINRKEFKLIWKENKLLMK